MIWAWRKNEVDMCLVRWLIISHRHVESRHELAPDDATPVTAVVWQIVG
jgi:hypothetical protein